MLNVTRILYETSATNLDILTKVHTGPDRLRLGIEDMGQKSGPVTIPVVRDRIRYPYRREIRA
jgi:hypothetical protein